MMKKSPCENLLEVEEVGPKFADLRSAYIVNCVFNSFLSYTAIMLNIVTIHAMRKASSLSKTLKTLLLSLAVSDLGVGLLGQPFYTSVQVKLLLQKQNPDCHTFLVFGFIISVFLFASFLTVLAISVDRFLAIHLHLRYKELVTHKRVAAVVISIWLLSVFLPLTPSWISLHRYSLINLFFLVIGFSLTKAIYIRIYFAARRHKNQIQALQVQEVAENGEIANFVRLLKSAVCVFYVYLVFLVCYVPFFISEAAKKIHGPSISLSRFSLFSWTLLFLNSSLNPLIYCWKMRHIRHAVMDILRNMPWFRNRGTH